MKNTSSIAFTGDIGFDKYMHGRWSDESLLSQEIYDFFNGADHVVANLEGALYAPPSTEKVREFFHAMDPGAIGFLKRINSDVWNICNNHIMDAGDTGLVNTKAIAGENGCVTVGAGINVEDASRPTYIDEAGGIGIIGVGYNDECVPATPDSAGCLSWDNFSEISRRIAEIKEKCRWCVVVSHGGEEFAPIPLPYTRDRYIKYLELGADIVVGHHPHVPENYELFDNGKMIFYSLGNFIFDTDYQRVHSFTDVGVLLKLNFTTDNVSFEALGIKTDRNENKLNICPLPDIFTNIDSKEYELLAPLGAKAFVVEDARKMRYLHTGEYEECSDSLERYFSGCSHDDYVKGSHMDFDIIMPLAEKYNANEWQKSKLEKVKEYILGLM